MPYNFDEIVERRGTDCGKWSRFGDDVIPMWVADMDFRSPEPVIRALHKRIEHGVFGYGSDGAALKELICQRMADLYSWQITPEDILYLPGLVSGLNVVSRAIGRPGDGVLVTTPVYPPFLSAPGNQERVLHSAQLAVEQQDQLLRYSVDYDALVAAIQPNTRLFLLCNPHNPVGRAYTQNELLRLADICLRRDVIICSDEIHSDLLLGDTRHIPIASLDAEVAENCITLLAPSKTYNLAGLGCSMAIVQNPELRQQLQRASAGIVPHVNVLGMVAAQAAYAEGDEWLTALRAHLTANRAFLIDFVTQHWPEVRLTAPEATYLAWLDFGALGLPDKPQAFFLEQARVALVDGAAFGLGGEGFVRLNFGCPQTLLAEGLARMDRALRAAQTE
ncbi:MAG: putative C-S lyase [Chloroflexi bacterium]|nr:MAG: putative C-S lyase [Chloroflexota bacterium]